jgi:hypothetical protein
VTTRFVETIFETLNRLFALLKELRFYSPFLQKHTFKWYQIVGDIVAKQNGFPANFAAHCHPQLQIKCQGFEHDGF